jgi:isopenicillin N synthase-like dioxygenase
LSAPPTLDLSLWRTGIDDGAREAFSRDLVRALHGPGFAYLVGHGVAAGDCRELFGLARGFFSLPEREKNRVGMIHSPHFRGYSGIGGEVTNGNVDAREQLDFGFEQSARSVPPGAPPYLRLDGPNQWPTQPEALRGSVTRMMAQLESVARDILSAIAVGLTLPQNYFDDLLSPPPRLQFKLMRYRGPAAWKVQQSQGLGAHRDGGLVTLVLQDVEPGLEMLIDDGSIMEVLPIPGTLVLNIGEMLELLSRRFFRATVHRVQAPAHGRDRFSAAFFVGPRLDAVVEAPLLPKRFRTEEPESAAEEADRIFSEYGWNALKHWARSHPAVARRYYQDVL